MGAYDNSRYELNWRSTGERLLLVDCKTHLVVDLSPALAGELGYSQGEWQGLALTGLLRTPQGGALLLAGQRLPSRCHALMIDRGRRARLVELTLLCEFPFEGRFCALLSLVHLPYPGRQPQADPVQEWALSAYGHAASVLVQEKSVLGILRGICKAVTDQQAYTMAWVGVASEAAGKPIRILASDGYQQADIPSLVVSWDEGSEHGKGIVGEAIRTGKLWIVQDTHDTERFLPWLEWGDANRVRSLIALPFQLPQSQRAVLAVYSSTPYAFDEMTITVFSHLLKQLEHALAFVDSRTQLQYERTLRKSVENQLAESYLATIQALAASVEARDLFTAGHQKRVGWLAEQIGRRMGWEEERLQGLQLAAAVHDIGKLNIPIEVLCKTGRLTADEWQQVRNHPLVGYRILKDIPFPWKIAEVVYQHHERLDGSGYPQGLRGGEILEEARVLIVADMLDAMASDRPYRKALPLERVLAELAAEAGGRLDAVVVATALELFGGRSSLFEELEQQDLPTP